MATRTPRPVLAGVDNTASSLAAVDVAAAEAAARKLPLRLVCVHPRSSAPAPPAHQSAGPDGGLLVDRARRRVAHRYPDLPVSTTVAAGEPTAVLVDEARRAELVVVGHQRRPGTGGGVATAVASRADCPVVVTPVGADGGWRLSAQPVVVGIKGSDRDASAVAFGLAEAALHDVPLRAVPGRHTRHAG